MKYEINEIKWNEIKFPTYFNPMVCLSMVFSYIIYAFEVNKAYVLQA